MKILAISGSLRQLSINKIALRAAVTIAPPGVEISVYDRLEKIPPFNPDLDGNEPDAVLEFRATLAEADAVLISSPEYAHGISGVLKNALDWVVSSGELSSNKPVAILNVSSSSVFADVQLREIIKTMDAFVVAKASLSIPLQGKKLDEAGLLANPQLSALLKESIDQLVKATDANE